MLLILLATAPVRSYSFGEYLISILAIVGIWTVYLVAKVPSIREKLWKVTFGSRSKISSKDRKRFEIDGQDPVRRWARCAFSVQSGYSDAGYLSPSAARKDANVKSWKLSTREDAERILQGLDDSKNSAKDLIRYMYFARLSAALGLMSDDESWRRIRPICLRLQRSYPSFEAMAQEYKQARLGWLGIDPIQAGIHPDMKYYNDLYDWLRKEVWSKVPFQLDLG